jgi:hypothetical protein
MCYEPQDAIHEAECARHWTIKKDLPSQSFFKVGSELATHLQWQ